MEILFLMPPILTQTELKKHEYTMKLDFLHLISFPSPYAPFYTLYNQEGETRRWGITDSKGVFGRLGYHSIAFSSEIFSPYKSYIEILSYLGCLLACIR
jgi:hypothetical protein